MVLFLFRGGATLVQRSGSRCDGAFTRSSRGGSVRMMRDALEPRKLLRISKMTTSAIINDLLPALTDVTCYMRLTWGIYPLIMDACMHVHLEGGSYLHVASNGGFYVYDAMMEEMMSLTGGDEDECAATMEVGDNGLWSDEDDGGGTMWLTATLARRRAVRMKKKGTEWLKAVRLPSEAKQ
ncbi:hypothetical protein LR48_Vigan03g237800 [Vigna angularis]|uniref:Uncharacterized protein n=1 Tax=Phaseolus angularis TaxID=3914 RepID=A0A0L9U8D5_PHAAN|nr:hypothetical protein LR48_Vigan03g237800 [Vigna angularis]